MVRVGCLIIALAVFPIAASAQENPLASFPLRVGSRWVYEHEDKSGDRNRADVYRWTTEETISGLLNIPEGLVVLREVKSQAAATGQTLIALATNGQIRQVQTDKPYDGDALVARDRQPYLVRGNCVYVIDGWDNQRRELRPEYRRDLVEGNVSPDFCFPLQTGSAWGSVQNGSPWRVEPARLGTGSFLPPGYAGAIHLFSDHVGSGGSEDVWFQRGVGVVARHYVHNGTYDEYTKKLQSFR